MSLKANYINLLYLCLFIFSRLSESKLSGILRMSTPLSKKELENSNKERFVGVSNPEEPPTPPNICNLC
eukprot:UN18718